MAESTQFSYILVPALAIWQKTSFQPHLALYIRNIKALFKIKNINFHIKTLAIKVIYAYLDGLLVCGVRRSWLHSQMSAFLRFESYFHGKVHRFVMPDL